MIDPRFHTSTGAARFADLARRAGYPQLSTSAAAGVLIATVADLADATPDALSFVGHAKYGDMLKLSGAGVVLSDPKLELAAPDGIILVPCPDPYAAFIAMIGVLFPDATRTAAKASSATAAPTEYYLEDDVVIGPGAVIGKGAEIGRGTVIGANTIVGAGVAIGRDCVIGPGCVIECAYLGNEVVLQPGVVIGAEGFGFKLGRNGHLKIPQLGRVIVQDRVEIGANSTVDRGTLADTVIGEGTKIDNLVQIGHNCRIGRNCVISGMCGLSGSTVLEDNVIMGGGAGTAGHLTIGAGSTVFARSGVSHNIPAGSNIAGAPAVDVRVWRREIAAVRRLSKGDKG